MTVLRTLTTSLIACLALVAGCAESPTSPMPGGLDASLNGTGGAFLPGEQQPLIALPNLANWAIYPEGAGQNLTQTFTPAQDQWLGYLQLPVGCAAGVLLNVKIRDGLAGPILYEANAAGLPQTVDGSFQLLQVYNPAVSPLGIALQAHHTYAFELAAFPGPGAAANTCGMPTSPSGSSYSGGKGYYRDLRYSTTWVALPSGAPNADQDLPFITLVQPRSVSSPLEAVLAGTMWFKSSLKDWRVGADTRFEGGVPMGRITFQDGGQRTMAFVAERIRSIAITGTKAVIQADGFIRGRPGTFTILAVLRDGGSGLVNGARVRLTDSLGAVVFDNKPGQPIDSDSVTARIESHLTIQRTSPAAMPVATVQVTLAADSLTVGQTSQATAVLRDANGVALTGRAIAWTTSDSAVATVTANGLVTAVATGVAEIRALSEGKSSGAVVTVTTALGLPAIVAGTFHTCGLTSAGVAYCWGWGGFGQLGNGSNADRSSAMAVAGALSFQVLAAGYYHTCGLTSAGAAYCWGDNRQGQLGNGAGAGWQPWFGLVPVAVAGGHTFTALVADEAHTCALTSAGAAYCWGSNLRGELGNGSTANSPIPVAVSGGLSFSTLGTGFGHTCALTSAGSAWCWGRNNRGQLGNGTTANSLVPVAVSGGRTFTAIDAGDDYTCALTSSGAAWCWGANGNYQLGTGSSASSSIPVAVSGGLSFTDVAAGGLHACGLTSGGSVYCWGSNFNGAFGNGTTNTMSPSPIPVSGGLRLGAIAAGSSHTCGLTVAGAAYCWGLNRNGQVGNGSILDVLVPVAVLAWP